MNTHDEKMPVKIISGKGCLISNGNQMKNLGNSCLIITGGKSAVLSGALDNCIKVFESENIKYSIFNGISPNPLTVQCFEAGKRAVESGADFICGIGGGSVLDASKAAAIYASSSFENPMDIYKRDIPAKHLPVVLIGTTAGTGSEVTGVSVLTNPLTGKKKSISGKDCYAEMAFCDWRYTMSMDNAQTLSTALDAFCHAVEAYLSSNAERDVIIYASEAIRLLREYILSTVLFMQTPDEKLRETLYAASLFAGLAINIAGTDFPHTVGYYLTENYAVPHGRACAAFMPLLLKRAKKYCPDKLEAILRILETDIQTLSEAVKAKANVHPSISYDEAYKAAQAWKDGVKNFDRSPGGFTTEDAINALIEL